MTDPRPPAAGTTDGSGGTSPDVTDTCDGLRLETSRPADGTVVVAVTGELDMLTAPELRHAVAEQISAAAPVQAAAASSLLHRASLAALLASCTSCLC